MPDYVTGTNTPTITQEFYDAIARKVPALEVRPGCAQDELMFTAGMHEVLGFIRQAIGNLPSGMANKDIR